MILIRTVVYAAFNGGQIVETDYFESRARERGLAWLFMDWVTWHVMLPTPPPKGLSVAFARPVTGRRELNGWQWCLELDGRHYLLPRDQIKGLRPPLPEPVTHAHRNWLRIRGQISVMSSFVVFALQSP